LVERWTRSGPNTLEYVATIEDPTVWTQTWTVKQEFIKQSDKENRIYTEPRCIEGNYGLPGLLHGRRMQERAFAEGKGPDPATQDHIKGGFLLERRPVAVMSHDKSQRPAEKPCRQDTWRSGQTGRDLQARNPACPPAERARFRCRGDRPGSRRR
jgi:hypothetical protein